MQSASSPFVSARAVAALLALLTAARVAALILTPLDLHGDEAQYWNWSRTLDWGYFSKPPLIAWTIRATTALFGNAEWAVRLAAPLAQGAAAMLLYALARRLYNKTVGAWAAIGWALMPGVQLSSVIISTDALLLPLWAASLYCLWRLIETGKASWAIGLGLALGFGVMAKYAMFYFLIGITLACLMSRQTRARVLSLNGALALVIALIVIAPNLIWNATHGFETVAHTASNAAIGKSFFHPENVLTFLGEQLAVVGPIQFFALAYLLIDAARRRNALEERDRFLLAFVAPALTIITVQALISRANANWAVAAYPAAVVWIAGRFTSGRGKIALQASAALHAVIAIVLFTAVLSADFANAIGAGNSLKRARNWETTAALVAEKAQAAGPITAVLVDNRLLYYDLAYYWRDGKAPAPLRMWLLEDAPQNSAEQSAPMQAKDGARPFIVMATGYRDYMFADFNAATPVGALDIPLGGKKTRHLELAVGSGFAPVPRNAAFMEKLNARRDANDD